MATTLFVRKSRLADTRIADAPAAPLRDGQVRLRIEHFALTSNNITYAAFGEAMNYWRFFPSGESEWGIVPVWGFAGVQQSSHPGVAPGQRLYGYFPMADSVVLEPVRVSPTGFSDGQTHRSELHAVYNQYLRCDADPLYRPGTEAVQALLRPLFTTSWLIDDFLHDNQFFGARTMLLSSASSKTAYGTAFELAKRRADEGIDVIGFTSQANLAFCESLGCYSRVLAYEQLEQIDAQSSCVYVDFAGNAALRKAIHARFAKLTYSCSVGGTHVEQLGGAKDLPGPRATLFFAPAQVKKRRADWGAAEFAKRLAQAWHAFEARASDPANPWIIAQWHRGPQAVQEAYAQVLNAKLDPRAGLMLSFSAP